MVLTRCLQEQRTNLFEQLIFQEKYLDYYALGKDESNDITATMIFMIFVRGIDSTFQVREDFVSSLSLNGTRGKAYSRDKWTRIDYQDWFSNSSLKDDGIQDDLDEDGRSRTP